MAIKSYNPTSAGRRFGTVLDFAEITKTTPEKSLISGKRRTGGRNNHGHLTRRHRAGGNKRQYRLIDFKRNKDGVPAKVHSIEYDPNRSARIALLHYADGEKRYIVAPQGLEVGRTVTSGTGSDPLVGNSRFTTSSCVLHAARSCAARPARSLSSPHAKANTPSSCCPRASCARCTLSAVRRSAVSATPITRT